MGWARQEGLDLLRQTETEYSDCHEQSRFSKNDSPTHHALGATRTPLLEFPEWKCVDTQSLVWGIRHRRTATPFNFTVFRDDGSFASKLVGITFSYQAKPTESVMLQFHCTDKPQNVLPKVIGEDFRTEQISPLVAEARVRINRRRATTAIEQSPQNRGHYSGSEMQFRIAWFMGYVVCP